MQRMTPTKSTTPRNKTPKNTGTVGINVQLPEALHRQMRVKALSSGVTLSEAVTAALKAWVR